MPRRDCSSEARPTGRARDGACVETKGVNAPDRPRRSPPGRACPGAVEWTLCANRGAGVRPTWGRSDAVFGHGLVPAQFLQSPIRDRAGELVRGLHVGLR